MQENSSKNVHTILDKYGLQSGDSPFHAIDPPSTSHRSTAVDDTACLLGQISKIPFQVNKVRFEELPCPILMPSSWSDR